MTTRIFVPRDAAARAVGADKVAAAILDEAKRRGLSVELVRTGSRGLFWLEPMIEVETPAGRIAFGPVTAADVPGLFADGLPSAGHPLCVGRPGGNSLPQAPDAHHLRALRHHRSAVARRLSRPWRLARPRARQESRCRPARWKRS